MRGRSSVRCEDETHMFTLPKLYPIADLETLVRQGMSLDDFVRQVSGGGAEILQLRDKRGTPEEVLTHAATTQAALAGSSCLAVMNDRADLAVLAGWRAVHVGHRDLPPEGVRRIFGQAGARGTEVAKLVVVGQSTHTDEQVIGADRGSADYLAIGPVFATGTKTDAEPVVGLPGVRSARALTRKPLVAIGGITLANAASVIEAGADSVAVIGALFALGGSVESRVRDFLRRLR